MLPTRSLFRKLMCRAWLFAEGAVPGGDDRLHPVGLIAICPGIACLLRLCEEASMKTLYELLGVGPDASEEALKTAYRKLAKMHHPDLNPNDPDAARRFRQVATAIEILRDSEQRAAYDSFLDWGRRQRHLRWTRIIIADAIAAASLVVVLVGGYALLGPTFSTSTMVSE